MDEEPTKTVSDADFANRALADGARLNNANALIAAETLTVRQLLGFAVELLEIAQDRRFEKEAAARFVQKRDKYKGWALAIGAFLSLALTLFAAWRTVYG